MNQETVKTNPASNYISGALAPNALVRLVFREVLPGDRLKFTAESNTAKTGGGARDFRYSPYEKFEGVFERMLAGRRNEQRTRDGKPSIEVIYTSSVNVVKKDGSIVAKPLEFEPPTTARPGEGRLTRLNHFDLQVPDGNEGRVFLLLYQTNDGRVHMAFATEDKLRKGAWHKTVADFLVDCMDARRPAGNAAQGFIDVVSSSKFCKCSSKK